MNTTHTPGPWQLRGSRLVTDSQGVLIAEKIQANYPGTPEANARLIAAAPDLLAALEEQHRLIEQFLSGALVVYPSAIRHQVAALIEHAKGIPS